MKKYYAITIKEEGKTKVIPRPFQTESDAVSHAKFKLESDSVESAAVYFVTGTKQQPQSKEVWGAHTVQV